MKFTQSFIVSALAILTAVTPTGGPGGSDGGDSREGCNAGTLQCCNKVTDKNNPGVTEIYDVLGINSKQSSPSLVVAIQDDSTTNPVYCENN
ncbi:hypothetical protein PQX77_001706 [Marasmius sp. AFHP31]|nr:hypothetical protein PQX77_001706 [Marasmius sp. AFHP31]